MTEFICTCCDALCVLDVEDDDPDLPILCPYSGKQVIWERIGDEVGFC